MLVNLEYWRKNNIESQLLEFAKRKREPVYLHDQDVLNYVLRIIGLCFLPSGIITQ